MNLKEICKEEQKRIIKAFMSTRPDVRTGVVYQHLKCIAGIGMAHTTYNDVKQLIGEVKNELDKE